MRYGHRPCPEDILRLEHDNNYIRACVDLWRSGEMSWEQAMMYCVTILAERQKAFDEWRISQTMKSVQPISISLSPEQAEQLKEVMAKKEEKDA